jgi:parallel beta-helix repeat protein
MRRKSGALLFFLILTTSSIASALPVKAEYNGNITIDADGRVNPSTAPLKQAGNAYSLTGDINGTITINNNNMVLDGNGYRLSVPSIFNYGITLNGVSNVTVTNFTITGGAKGIDITGSTNIIANNTISGADNWIYSMSQPTAAISLNDASSNLITGNNLKSNKVGLGLVSWSSKQCSNNQIVGNNFTDCSTAINIYDSSNNRFYYNNFFNNRILLNDNGYYGYSLPSFNIWDDSHKFGNYWSDYEIRYPYATEISNTGVGDTPYFVKPNNYVDPSTVSRQEAKDYWTHINAQYANNTDHYPLMQPFNIDDYLLRTTPPRISVLSPTNQTYNKSSTSLVFSVNKPLNWTGYSLDGQDNVTVAGNATLSGLAYGVHNVTVYAKDMFGNVGTSETVSFSVEVPFPTTLVVTASGVAVVIVGAGLLVYFKKRKH